MAAGSTVVTVALVIVAFMVTIVLGRRALQALARFG
jgi:hypothetical protein